MMSFQLFFGKLVIVNALIVHNYEDIIKLIQIYLGTLKLDVMDVYAAQSISGAIQTMEAQQNMDLIISDAEFEDGRFSDILQHVKKRNPHAKVILFSSDDFRDGQIEDGDVSFVKSNDYLNLKQEIKKMLSL